MSLNKKIFISYSHGNKEHQDWVVNLGKRLTEDSVDVMLDIWNLKVGQDVHSFMEEMVKSADIFRVLIISNKKYTLRANQREGGVGTEAQIISSDLYGNQKQEKFVPIVLEIDEKGKPYLPVYLSSIKYIDFSREKDFESSYKELVETIFEKPAIPKPKLGLKPPAYITENKIDVSETNSKLRTIENQLKKNPILPRKFVDDFIDVFLKQLWSFNIEKPPRDLDDFGIELINTLQSFKLLREDFIQFIDLLSSNENTFAGEIIIDFFEKSAIYSKPKDDKRTSCSNLEPDFFKIIFHELFLYVIAIGLKNKDYDFVSELLKSKYYLENVFRPNDEPKSFTFLSRHHENLERYMCEKYTVRYGFGDYVIKNLSNQIDKETLILADTLCYVVSHLNIKHPDRPWNLNTYGHLKTHGLMFFKRMSSKKHFEKVKSIFDVESKNELVKKLENDKNNPQYGNRNFGDLPFASELIDSEKISVHP